MALWNGSTISAAAGGRVLAFSRSLSHCHICFLVSGEVFLGYCLMFNFFFSNSRFHLPF